MSGGETTSRPTGDRRSRAKRYFETGHLGEDLKGRSVRGGSLTLAAQACRFSLQFASTVCLARVLSPEEFGIVAMVTAVTSFVTLFNDLGLSLAVVQRPEINHGQVSTLFWFNVGLSVLLAGLTAALAPLLAWFYGEPRLIGITMALGVGFVFSGLTVQHQALLRRQMEFRALAVVDISSTAAMVLVGMGLALAGWGPWALVGMYLTLPAAMAIGVWWVCTWRPGWPGQGTGVRAMLAFGGHLTVFNVVNYFARNLDRALIGWRWGATSLGLYTRAYSLLILPIQQVTPPVAAIAIPALSRLCHEPQRYRSFYLQAITMLTFVTMPLSLFLLCFAEEVVSVALGRQWGEAAGIFRLLGVCALAQPLWNSVGWLYVSSGRTRDFMRFGCWSAPAIVGAFVVGLPYGAEGVALAYALTILALLAPSLRAATRHSLIRVGEIFGAVAPSLLSAAVAVGVALACRAVFFPRWPAWATLLAALLLASAVYLGILFYGFNKREMYVSMARGLLRSRSAPVA